MKLKLVLCIMIMIELILFFYHPISIQGTQMEKRILYFYSPTCGECSKSAQFLDDIEKKYNDILIVKYNISEKEGMGLFKIYCKNYEVLEDDCIVPAVFISKKALMGLENIKLLEYELESLSLYNTPQYTYDETIFLQEDNFKDIKSLGIFVAGFINGLNPCSFAMFLFLFSLLTLKKGKFLKVACIFLMGKFLTFFLMGTVLFKFLSYINISYIMGIVKIMLSIFILVLLLLNILDYISTRKNEYGKIKLQLPKQMRKFNHNIMKKVNHFLDSKYLFFFVFLISIGVSLTEFMCTGQIYLVTIVTLLQFSEVFNIRMLIYFLIYNIALILPLLFVTIILFKGQDVFTLSERIRKNMPIIKIVNVLFLSIILSIIWFL